jgi:hypothetical protein
MSRRPTLPGADELFRATSGELADPAVAPTPALAVAPALAAVPAVPAEEPAGSPAATDEAELGRSAPGVRRSRRPRRRTEHRPSGRERHEEKITVYLSPEELMELERARMDLFAANGLKVDRGRIVREAVAIVLADLEAKGDHSILVKRLLDA